MFYIGSGQLEHACMQWSGMRRGDPKGGGPGREIRSSGREIRSSGREIRSSLRPFVQPAARVPPRLVGFVILAGVAWVTRSTIIHHFGIDLFPMFPKK
jgi:hypothetical protein